METRGGTSERGPDFLVALQIQTSVRLFHLQGFPSGGVGAEREAGHVGGVFPPLKKEELMADHPKEPSVDSTVR